MSGKEVTLFILDVGMSYADVQLSKNIISLLFIDLGGFEQIEDPIYHPSHLSVEHQWHQWHCWYKWH